MSRPKGTVIIFKILNKLLCFNKGCWSSQVQQNDGDSSLNEVYKKISTGLNQLD